MNIVYFHEHLVFLFLEHSLQHIGWSDVANVPPSGIGDELGVGVVDHVADVVDVGGDAETDAGIHHCDEKDEGDLYY